MVKHQSTLRLRVIRPALLSQNNHQTNNRQDLRPIDFEGSLFDRKFRQGSGLHPQTGSPQNQWAVSFSHKPEEPGVVCSSGALAVLSDRRERSPAGHYHLKNFDHNLVNQIGFGAGGSAFVNWLIWPSRNVIRSLLLARSALSCFTSSLSMAMSSLSLARAGSGAVFASSGRLITHWLPTFCPVSNPLVALRLTVFVEPPRACAASFIEYCIPKRVTQMSNPKPEVLTHSLPNLPMLSKCNHG